MKKNQGLMRYYVGIENEYGVFKKGPNSGNIVSVNIFDDQHAERKWKELCLLSYPLWGFTRNPTAACMGMWLTNGGKVYRDIAATEYSSPECLRVEDVVLAEKAGERIMLDLHAYAEDQEHLYILKRSATELMRKLETWGSHENYAVPGLLYWEIMKENSPACGSLLAHIASRQVVTGAGHLVFLKGAPLRLHFWVSPRMCYMDSDLGTMTRGMGRSLLNQRNESLMEQGTLADWSRLHIIAGDMNRSDWSLYLKTGTTCAVLAFLEYAERGAVRKLVERLSHRLAWVDMARIASQPFPRDTQGLFREMVMVQYKIWDALWSQKNALEERMPEFRAVMKMWRNALSAVSGDAHQYTIFSKRLDWLIKKTFIEQKMGAPLAELERYENQKGVQGLASLNFSYGRIGHGDFYRFLVDSGMAEEMYSREDVSRLISAPPEGRAAVRTAATHYLIQKGLRPWLGKFDWGAMGFMGKQGTDQKIISFDGRGIEALQSEIDSVKRWLEGHDADSHT